MTLALLATAIVLILETNNDALAGVVIGYIGRHWLPGEAVDAGDQKGDERG